MHCIHTHTHIYEYKPFLRPEICHTFIVVNVSNQLAQHSTKKNTKRIKEKKRNETKEWKSKEDKQKNAIAIKSSNVIKIWFRFFFKFRIGFNFESDWLCVKNRGT